MYVPLITDEQFTRLMINGRKSADGEVIDPIPVVKLFTPDARCTWLLTEVKPTNKALFFGLCDLGVGTPELGHVTLAEIKAIRGPSKMPVERDLFFSPGHPLSWYVNLAQRAKRIISG